ncbi:hypothetical protein KIN20_016857 [Parelaphostrongylus tenuis]|uniref:Uncharacterized protein n=1 Tax=Parelaphostrongylus tenuis TaxID=148309 RepID=A0AAD5N063_PARTN|nr:hypothetical protein KIN20_016857 [Parelaphostrongylus tenuis]
MKVDTLVHNWLSLLISDEVSQFQVNVYTDKDDASKGVKDFIDALSRLRLTEAPTTTEATTLPSTTSTTTSSPESRVVASESPSSSVTASFIPCSIDHLTQVEKIEKHCDGVLEFANDVCKKFFVCVTNNGSSYLNCSRKVCAEFKTKKKKLLCWNNLFHCP